MYLVNSHLVVKIYIFNHICVSLQHHDNKIKFNFRLCNWTPQSREKYPIENLPYTKSLIF